MSLQIIPQFKIDFYDKKYLVINAKQYDKNSRFISIVCYNRGKIYPINASEHSAYIRYKKSDNHSVFNFCDINNKGEIIVELTEQMLASSGFCFADLVIVNKGDAKIDTKTGEIVTINNASILSTMIFCIDVSGSAVENTEIESSYEYNSLNDLLQKVEADYREVIQLARSYAIGNADGIRENENYDNSKYYYEQAFKSAGNAETSALNAANSEELAENHMHDALDYKNDAFTYMTNANTYMNNAKTSEINASVYATDASTSEINAKTSENNAKVSETNAKTSEANALDSANIATTKANEIVDSAIAAANSESNAKLSETNTKTSEINAYDSAIIASNYANISIEKSEIAITSATNAISSEVNAKDSELKSKVSETNAKNSEINAKTYSDNASVYATDASTSEINAKTSELLAKQYAEMALDAIPDDYALLLNNVDGILRKDVNATLHGLNTTNTGIVNSQSLQTLIDTTSANGGGTIYIPAGTYLFGSNGSQTIGNHCIKLKSNIRIVGDGATTILKPTGKTEKGLDMFYYNDYVDNGSTTFLENCIFENFVIDGIETSVSNYTTSGKGFMINLFKKCHWRNVIVKNTDATGFGVDCPHDSSIISCIAAGCGKAATSSSYGASGFGIGFGESNDESIIIENCRASGNKVFGFFFEHQGRFVPEKYTASNSKGFIVSNCTAWENYYNFGTNKAFSVLYRNCFSTQAIRHGYAFINSHNCNAVGCYSVQDADTSFVILQDNQDGDIPEVKDIVIDSCISKYCEYGAKVVRSIANSSDTTTNLPTRNAIKNCFFNSEKTKNIATSGVMEDLILFGNVATGGTNELLATVVDLVDKNNSWN